MFPTISLIGIHIPTYGLCLVLGITLSAVIAFFRAKKIGTGFYDLLIVLASAMLLAVIGTRLLYILITFTPSQIGAILRSGQGLYLFSTGQVFYGGLIGGLAGALLAIRLLKHPLAPYVYALVPCIPLAHAIGRIGCFFAGCCHGSPYQGALAVPITLEGVTQSHFPLQLVEALLLFLLSAVLFVMAGRMRLRKKILDVYLLSYALIRFALEYFRGDSLRGVWLGLSTSQWISLMIVFSVTAKALIGFAMRHPSHLKQAEDGQTVHP